MTQINIFLENKEKVLHTDTLQDKVILNIDEARSFCVGYLSKLHFDSKYKIEIEIKEDSNSMNIIFDKDVLLNREYIINSLINDK